MNTAQDIIHRRVTVLHSAGLIYVGPASFHALKFEVVTVPEDGARDGAGVKDRARKCRSRVIQEDEEENEWNQDQLENSESEEASSYEV